jgi:hypothetical protein
MKSILLLSVLFMTLSYAQEIKQVSQISVTGDIKIRPLSPPRYKQRNNAKEVKKENDQHIEAVLKIIKKKMM